METLPPPPAAGDGPAAETVAPAVPERPRHPPRPGDLTPGWRVVVGIGWLGVAVVLAATWNASRQLGLSTWWLGPVHDERPLYVMLLPFVAPAVVTAAVANRVRYVPWIGVAAAVATAAVGVGDIGRVRGLGVVELTAAAAGLLASLAAFSGMYLAADASDGPSDGAADEAPGVATTPDLRSARVDPPAGAPDASGELPN